MIILFRSDRARIQCALGAVVDEQRMIFQIWKTVDTCYTCSSIDHVVHENDIEEDDHEFPQQCLEYLVHSHLECCQCVRQAKWHHDEFVMVVMHLESNLLHVNTDLAAHRSRLLKMVASWSFPTTHSLSGWGTGPAQ